MMKIQRYIGADATELLSNALFRDWPVEKSVDDDLEEQIVRYVFHDHGLELRCDSENKIGAIFLHSSKYGGFDDSLAGIRFSQTRAKVLNQFGKPQKSGEGFTDPILGAFGPWDRFTLPDCLVHFQYKTGSDEIEMITLMQENNAP